MASLTDPNEVIARARAWIGTPYLHQASKRGVGTDCLGLIRGLWREIHGEEPLPVPAYTRDWSAVSGDEVLLEAADRVLTPVPIAAARPGDVVVFRIRRRGVAKHFGILTPGDDAALRFIHAYDRVGVVESPLSTCWRRKIAGAFSFP